jgi:hypothetical protein
MLTGPDGRKDGRKIDYLKQPERWQHFDPPVFDLLQRLVLTDDTRALTHFQAADPIPGAVYFDSLVPDDKNERAALMERAGHQLSSSELVFFDPDNGLEVPSIAKGKKNSSKYVYRDEILSTYASGHSVLLYQHFPYEERSSFTRRIGEALLKLTGCRTCWAFTTPHVLFLLLIQEKHTEKLQGALEAMGAWPPGFMKLASLHADELPQEAAELSN